MNKRLLSLILVLCTILVSVPVFAFSATASTPETKIYEYATSFSENLPTVTDGTVTSNGNWEVFVYAKENNNGAGYYDGTIDGSTDELYDQQFDEVYDGLVSDFSGTHSDGDYFDAIGIAFWYSETESMIYVYGIGIVR